VADTVTGSLSCPPRVASADPKECAASPQGYRPPDFFLVGAPKCGTTALYRWLREHPELYLPTQKEPHGFGSDLDLPRLRGRAYLALFENVGDACRVGEASVFYLFSQRAASEIFDFNPRAQIVVMLRNPVDVMYAYHSERLWRGNEDIADFREALAAEPERRMGRRLPPGVRFPQGLRYREIATFSPQLERYLARFGPDRVHVILHDDLARDPAAVFAETCAFLGVAPGVRPSFEVVNGNRVVRNRWLRDTLRDRSSALRRLARTTLPLSVRQRAQRRLRQLNTRVEPRPPMDPELRRRLIVEFRPEVERLGKLLVRDLSHWSSLT
jgi:hypothetical protein